MIMNCRRCGTIFNKGIRDICPACLEEEGQLVGVIRAYLKENKMATILDVVHDTEIPIEVILDFIEERLLILVDNPNMSIECKRCGLPTQEGRFCENCKIEMVHELAHATQLVRDAKKAANGAPQIVYRSTEGAN